MMVLMMRMKMVGNRCRVRRFGGIYAFQGVPGTMDHVTSYRRELSAAIVSSPSPLCASAVVAKPIHPKTSTGRVTNAIRNRRRQAPFSTTSSTSQSSPPSPRKASGGERLKVAIVGGGVAGLSAALHLAPLVELGYLSSPIDIYEAGSRTGSISSSSSSSSSTSSSAAANPTATTAVGSGGYPRDIGVGVWSTALRPFTQTDRQSHRVAYEELLRRGSWIGDVGYRTPSGAWLMKSHLPTSIEEAEQCGMPALLFLREKDLVSSLQTATAWEEQQGLIRVHRGAGGTTKVVGLHEQSSSPWSTQLITSAEQITERDYHLIITADGTHSILRSDYGGYEAFHPGLNVTSSLSSPMDLPILPNKGSAQKRDVWLEHPRQDSVGLQDRKYTVFRGNANLKDYDGSTSFQTWGVGKSMRFATVPMRYPVSLNATEERQVWFITIDDDEISAEHDAVVRQAMLIDRFKEWHDPIGRMVASTPPDEILMERAIAHRHCMGPVINFNELVQKRTGRRPPNSGEGPCVVFIGDAFMTVDPILAQGFTVAMEGSFLLRQTIQEACVHCQTDSELEFDPYVLRQVLKTRHDARIERLICLLRCTELVQALGQPEGGTLGGFLNTNVLRPLVQLTPNFIKAPVFDAVLKYSLGFTPLAPETKARSR